MADALLDLLLGSTCSLCGHPGRVLCRPCERGLPRKAFPAWPTPTPAGLAPPLAVGEYDGPLKLLVNAHKEERRFALARPLGDLLSVAALGHIEGRDVEGRHGSTWSMALVPVPSRSSVVRRRGHDPLLRVATRAAGRLRAQGVDASVARVLRPARVTHDQAGLGAADRARNLAGSMTCHRGALRRVVEVDDRDACVVVVDDVITTGATVREAQRALEEAGVRVAGIATVAATRRTSTGPLVHRAVARAVP